MWFHQTPVVKKYWKRRNSTRLKKLNKVHHQKAVVKNPVAVKVIAIHQIHHQKEEKVDQLKKSKEKSDLNNQKFN